MTMTRRLALTAGLGGAGVIDSASGVKSGAGEPRSSHSRQLRSIQYDDVHSISHNQCRMSLGS
jgi:hypothetical protein